jgi:hypothetical protein
MGTADGYSTATGEGNSPPTGASYSKATGEGDSDSNRDMYV